MAASFVHCKVKLEFSAFASIAHQSHAALHQAFRVLTGFLRRG
jgi:hypothetical protein